MRALIARAACRGDRFDPRGLPLALARSLLALAQLVFLLFTPDHALFVDEPGLPGGMQCAGLRRASLWCAAGPGPDGLRLSRLVAVVVLAAAMSGYRPRWTCIPQWYVTFSLATAVTLPEGGDDVAMIVTLLLIPMSLGDDRLWQWHQPKGRLEPAWRGSSYAAWWALRCQVAVIYANAAVSKLGAGRWRDGTAMFTVLVDPNDGLPLAARHAVAPALASGFVIGLLTWGVIAIELCIATCALSGRRGRRGAVVLAAFLHTGILLAMGLFSFALIMMGAVLTLCVGNRIHAAEQFAGQTSHESPPAVDYAPTDVRRALVRSVRVRVRVPDRESHGGSGAGRCRHAGTTMGCPGTGRQVTLRQRLPRSVRAGPVDAAGAAHLRGRQ
jgi:antimicrobial peptide system SdpB family protein